MSLYRETPCEHGRKASHRISVVACSIGYCKHTPIHELCNGGSRTEVTIDYEAFHKALYEWYHSEAPMSADREKELVNAALGITEDQ